MEETIKCPKCNSQQLTANKKGFSGKKAVAGALLTGGIGLLAGTIGSNKIIITCLNCGNQFKPGTKPQSQIQNQQAPVSNQPTKSAGEPKFVWDNTTFKHVQNPNYKDPDKTVQNIIFFIIAVILISIIIYNIK